MNKKYLKIIASLFFGFYFIHYASYAKNINNWNWIDNINLIFHEAGHSIFFFLGEFIQVLAGSAFQIFIPCVFAIYFFFWRKEYFSGSIIFFWIGQNILNVAVYMGDAIKQQLPLLGGDSVIHDWNYLLSSTGLLKYTDTLSTITFNIGFLTIITASVLCVYLSFETRESQV